MTTFPRMTLSYTPATVGWGVPVELSAAELCPGTVIPQSYWFPVTMLSSMRLPCVGPVSSVSSMPPVLPLE